MNSTAQAQGGGQSALRGRILKKQIGIMTESQQYNADKPRM